MIAVNWYGNRGYWDQALLEDIFKDSRFEHDKKDEGCIYIVPGEYAKASEVNQAIKKYKWVILLITSDEQGSFPIKKLAHKNCIVYIMYPKQGYHDKYHKLPLGYSSETRKHLKLVDKDLNYYFAGQVTHIRREQCVEALQTMEKEGKVLVTDGFAKGLDPLDYVDCMNRTKVAPAPSGPICPDSFRLYEALEAGAVPIADNISPAGAKDYFNYLFDNPPFPTIDDYADLPGYIEDQLNDYPRANNRLQAWWIMYKRQLKQKLIDQAAELSGKAYKQATTIVVPVSPIKSHPSTEKLDKCIESIRHHFKDAEIIITFDGVRKEHESRRADYEEFVRRALFKCNTEWFAIPIIFDKHTHQVGMMREALQYIDTPTVTYVEGDTGLVLDREIDWEYIYTQIINGTSNLIRLHFEGRIPDEHLHMMLERQDRLIQTAQWSQRPHVASTAYYRRILNDHFSKHARSFVEDKMHGVVAEAHKTDGLLGWQQHRIHIYAPEENIKYSVDFDGREGEAKHDKDQVF